MDDCIIKFNRKLQKIARQNERKQQCEFNKVKLKEEKQDEEKSKHKLEQTRQPIVKRDHHGTTMGQTNPPISTNTRQKYTNLVLKETTMEQRKSSLKESYQEALRGKDKMDDSERRKKRRHEQWKRHLEFNKEKQKFFEEIRKQDEEKSKRRLEEKEDTCLFLGIADLMDEKEEQTNLSQITNTRQTSTNLALKETTMDQRKSSLKESYQEALRGKDKMDDSERRKKRRHEQWKRHLEFNKEKQKFFEEIRKQDEEKSKRRLEEKEDTCLFLGIADLMDEKEEQTNLSQITNTRQTSTNLALKETTMGQPSSANRKNENVYCTANTGERLLNFRTAQTQAVKQHQERNSLKFTDVDAGKTDVKPHPPISTNTKQTSTNLALKEKTMGQPSSAVGKNENIYCAADTGERLLNFRTAQTQAVKQCQEGNRTTNLALKEKTMGQPSSAVGKNENIYCTADTGERPLNFRTAQTQAVKQYQEHNRTTNLVLKETTMGQPSSADRKNENVYCTADTGERLLNFRTAQTQAVKQHQERSRTTNLVLKETTMGQPSSADRKNENVYCTADTGERLLNFRTAQTQAVKQHQERSRTTNLALKETTMGQPSSAVGKNENVYCTADTGERLLNFRTAQTQAVKQHQERSRTTNLALKETTMGQPSSAVGKNENVYCTADTGERLLNFRTAQTQAVKQHQERSRTTNLALKETTMGQPSSAVGKNENVYCTADTGERLLNFRTAQTQAVKQHQERSRTTNLALKETTMGQPSSAVGKNENVYCTADTGERLLNFRTAQTQAVKQRQEPNRTTNLALKEATMEQPSSADRKKDNVYCTADTELLKPSLSNNTRNVTELPT
ncbi:hypothetical protein PAMA_021213 [Pampus argenteus]